MATWHTPESARAGWLGAPPDEVLIELLEVARLEVVAYAPPLDPTDTETVSPAEGAPYVVQTVPEGYRWAQRQHARNVWNASTVNASGGFGAQGEGFGLTVFPLDWSIKQRLRPRTLFGGTVA